jgi:hypothetical protein
LIIVFSYDIFKMYMINYFEYINMENPANVVTSFCKF